MERSLKAAKLQNRSIVQNLFSQLKSFIKMQTLFLIGTYDKNYIFSPI